MASYNFVICMAIMFFASSFAAPSQDGESVIKIPSACKGQRFCDIKPEGYDDLEDEINSRLPAFLIGDYSDRLGEDVKPPTLSPKDDWHNCPFITKIESMYLYNHEDNITKTEIIVQTKLFRQYVEVVTCANEHFDTNSSEQCFQGLGLSDFGMKSACQTSTASRTLYVYDIDKKKVIQKSFEVPACCTCRVAYA